MSAILSADDLNDFISPGVACIKPLETLPKQQPSQQQFDEANAYEVTTEDKAAAAQQAAAPAQISLTDCLACSGCVTSAEAVLVSLQSHQEVLNTLDAHIGAGPDDLEALRDGRAKIFVASVSPQTRASIAALYGRSEREAGLLIEQLLAGPQGLKSGGITGAGFTWVVDTNTLREACVAACVDEALSAVSPADEANTTNGSSTNTTPKRPILASACPGWICYAEKTHPHVLPHLSSIKSPQALAGTMLKTVLSRHLAIPPSAVWHVAIMPCFDKKLEASREELTDTFWQPRSAADDPNTTNPHPQPQGVRDVDCVITARELLMLADTRGISLPQLPSTPVAPRPRFPDAALDRFLFSTADDNDDDTARRARVPQPRAAGPSGGYAYRILEARRTQLPCHGRGATIRSARGRNADVVEHTLRDAGGAVVLRTARYYGFRNIQNLVRRLKPQRASRVPGGAARGGRRAVGAGGVGEATAALDDYAYVEVMACPGGCTNGGGQIKAADVGALLDGGAGGGGSGESKGAGPAEQKAWLARVDEAYYSGDDGEGEDSDAMDVDGDVGEAAEDARREYMAAALRHWSASTGMPLESLLRTTYRQVESDVGKLRGASDTERVAGLASSIGGGW